MMVPRLVLLALFAGTVMGNKCSQGILSVSGIGNAEVQPDRAKVLLAVQSTKESAKAARDEAAMVTAAVTDAVSAVNSVSRSDITTTDVSMHPQINWDNGRQNIVGYTFNQRLQITVQNLTNDVLGAVIDAAVQAGGDNLQVETIQAELSAGLKREAMNMARVEAVENARAAAEVLAKASGVRLGVIKSCSETSSLPFMPGPAPMGKAIAAAEAFAATPINVGPSTTTVTAQMEFFIAE